MAALMPSSRSAFSAGNRAFTARRAPLRVSRRQQPCVRVRAYYPDPQFIEETLDAFPDKGVANVEEARALFSEGGYIYLDVRTALEYDEVGKVKGSVNIPFMNAKRVWNGETRTKEVVKEPNENFLAQVEKRFPNKETRLMVACNNGQSYTMDALMALDDAGYVNLVGLKGGYQAWFRTWDNKLNRRRYGEYAEDYAGEGSDSCGIHASGAGFDKVDKIEYYVPPSY